MADKTRAMIGATVDGRSSGRIGRFWAVAWIPAMACVLVIVIWIAVFSRIQTDDQEARDTVIASSAQMASAFSLHVAQTVHDTDAIVRWVKFEYERSPRTFNLTAFNKQRLITADTAPQITIAGADGRVLQTTMPNAQPVNLGDRLHFIIHKLHPGIGLYISQPVLGRVSGRWTLQFTRRLNNADGSFAGIVVVSEEPYDLTNGFYNLDMLGSEGMLAVISDSGNLLSRRTGQRSVSLEGPSATVYRRIMGAQGRTFDDPIDGIRRLVTYRHLDHYPAAVLVGLSTTNALPCLRSARRLYVLMAIAVSLALLFAAGAIAVMMRELTLLDGPNGRP